MSDSSTLGVKELWKAIETPFVLATGLVLWYHVVKCLSGIDGMESERKWVSCSNSICVLDLWKWCNSCLRFSGVLNPLQLSEDILSSKLAAIMCRSGGYTLSY